MTTVARAAQLTAVVLGALVLVLLLATAVAHLRRRWAGRRDAAARSRLTPLLLELLDGDSPAPAARSAAPVLDTMALELLPQLRGADRAALAGVLRERGVLDRAARACASRSPWRRAQAAGRLGAAGGEDHLGTLVALLRDPDAEVRAAAARALGKTGRAEVTEPLLAALAGPSPLPAGMVAMAVLDLGTAALPELRIALVHGSGTARRVAAEVLGWHGDIDAADELRCILRSVHQPLSMRRLAAEALGRIGHPAAVPDLLHETGTQAPARLRMTALTALGRIGHPDALRALRSALSDTDPDLDAGVRAAAADALVQLGSDGRELITRCARDRGPLGRMARSALARTRTHVPA